MNLTDKLFEKSKDLKKIAVFHKDQTITYEELFSRICSTKVKLNKLGIKKNEKVVIIADNSFFFVIAYFAIIANGCVAVPLFPRIDDKELQYILESCKVRTLFIQKKYAKKFLEKKFPMEFYFTNEEHEDFLNINELPRKIEVFADVNEKEDLAVMLFTSGSTGKPKGVMLSHYNINYNADSIIEYIGLTKKDRFMQVLPFFYCYGTSWLHTIVKVGGQIVINNRFMFPGLVLDEINEKECTGFAGVPSHFQILLRRSKFPKMKFPTLRFVTQAGGKLANRFIEELMNVLPEKQIFIMYGQTEATARLSYLPPRLLRTKLGSIGKGIPKTKISVLNKEGKPVKPGKVGELVAEGGNIMLGYWDDPEGTAKVLRDGKLHTEDLGTVDEDGFIYIVDREKHIIKSGGYRVSTKEVEDKIFEIPEVVEAAVIGIPDNILGEAIKLFVSIRKSDRKIDENFIIAHCKTNFPAHKVPKYVEFLTSLPKSSSNKVAYEDLKKRHGSN
ncbi:MAG: AMP-binding protein [Candidatus Helarchaeota archaeon]|nr:AMP-binding protein [Candidatus Helarchaeota archaeon]